MRAAKLLHDLLDNACQSIDKRLRRTLFEARSGSSVILPPKNQSFLKAVIFLGGKMTLDPCSTRFHNGRVPEFVI